MIFTQIKSADVFRSVLSHYGKVLYSNRFCLSTSACSATRFPGHVLSKQRSCPLILGFSSIWAWVTQPLLGLLDYRQVQTDTERTLDIHPLYKGTRLLFFPPVLNQILPPPRVLTPRAQVRRFGPSIMSGSSLQGRWMSSSVMEEDIKKLREARYLTAEILHRLPPQGQAVPSPEPNKSVVFVSHFL